MQKSNNKIRKKLKEENRGITLIALIITIIVLLILAGISITMLSGDNTILSNATRAAKDSEVAGVEEKANLIYMSKMMDGGYTSGVSMEDVVSKLKDEGYEIETAIGDAESITGITLDCGDSITISKDGTASIEVSYIGGSDSNNYYLVLKGNNYLMTKGESGIKIAREPSNIGSSGESVTLSATSGNTDSVTVQEPINGNIITLNGISVGSSTITVS